MKVSNSQNRLYELMDAFGIKQQDISAKTGIDKSTMSLYLSGKRLPRQDKIGLISDAYHVDPAWLMGYDVPMQEKNFKDIDTDKMFAITDPVLVEYAYKISKMDDTQKAIIFGMIDQMSR